MALATKCPHCNTIFRVAADQLKLRGGIVRCGSCHQVFDGNAALVEPAAKPTPLIPDVVAELAAPVTHAPAISDYVHGSPVDFEIDFAEQPAAAEPALAAPEPAPAASTNVPSTAAKPADVPPPAEVHAPAVWRTAASHAEPSPDDTARAAVARAFATVTAPPTVPPRAAAPSPAAPHPLAALVSPDDAFSQAAGEPPATGPWSPEAQAPVAIPPAAAPSAGIDEKLLVWEDIPENASAASDAAAMAAVARAFNHVTSRADEKKATAQEVAPVAKAPAPVAEELEPLAEEPAAVAAQPAPVAEEPAPVAEQSAPIAEEPVPLAEQRAPVTEEAVSDAEQPAPVAEEPVPVAEEAAPEALTPAPELPLPPLADEVTAGSNEQPAAEELHAVDEAQTAAPEAQQEELAPEVEALAIEAEDEEPSAPAGAALIEAIDQWSADNAHHDGRIEPSLVTPQEHIVLAAIDDAHHFEELPADETFVAHVDTADAIEASEPSLAAEPWTAAEHGADALPPGDEPWSLSEPEPERDDTALHAVAAVNTDAPDDGESLPSDEEQAAAEAALAAARMRALAGVDDPDDLDHSDLNFVKRVDRSQKFGKAATVTMAVGIPLLLAGLVLQAATTFRDTLAANYPQLKPALAAVCQPLGCKIALPTQLDALSVEPGELAAMAENTFSFSTVLRNQSKTVQAWPHLELTLNDNADKPVLRRVIAPREYLPSPAEAEKGFDPRSEQSIKLYFELKELKASGYHIAIFYP